VLAILIWWAVPLATAVLAAIVIAIVRRVRAARGDMETMDRYRRAREVLAKGPGSTVGAGGESDTPMGLRPAVRAVRSRQE
jgi:hypothetical protein